MNQILTSILENSIKNPDDAAIIEQNQQLTYQQLQYFIEKLSGELTTLNVNVIAIYMDNTSSWIMSDLAAANIGLTVVPIPLFFTSAQIKHLLVDSMVDVVVTSNDMMGNLEALINAKRYSDFIDVAYCFMNKLEPNDSLEGVCKITYTSGSTGTPKGVCLSGNTMASVVVSLASQLTSAGIKRHICLLPFATLLENVAGVYLPLFMGNAVITGSPSDFGLKSNHQFCPEEFIEANKLYLANSVILLPQMLKALAEKNQPKRLSSFTFMAVGGGKVSSELIEICHKQHLPVYEGYGLSECASVVSLNTPFAHKVGSVGKPLPHVKLQISSSGELIVKGSKMKGYLNGEEQTDDIATGDIAFIDDDGYLFITGRHKNIIISSFGRNISPEWVESTFLLSDQIQQLFVFGDAQPYLSAVIVPSECSTKENIRHAVENINATLPDYAKIKHWIIEEQAFSVENGFLTQNGKLRRDKLTQHYGYKHIPMEAAL